MREIISTKDAPQAIGPYSQAIKANGFIFVSGQIAIDPATQRSRSPEMFAAQTDRVLRNFRRFWKLPAAAWGRLCGDSVPQEHERLRRDEQVYGKYFSTAPPARSTVEVARLPKDVLVEIDVIALE